MKGINQSITGFALLGLVGVSYSLPTVAQAPSAQPNFSQQDLGAPPPSGTEQRSESAYILGAGDVLRVDSYDTPELVLEQRYPVLPDGTINLPWVKSIDVKGLTLREASERLEGKYSAYINKPRITVSLAAARTLKIGVIGEVTRPGSYIITSNLISTSAVSTTNAAQTGLNAQQGGNESGSQWPTVSRAIQAAGGINRPLAIFECRRSLSGHPSTRW